MDKLKSTQPAFVLLYAVLVVTVVLAVGLILINIITKQITLSIVGRNSQVAFYAADSGRDCLEYWYKRGVFGTSENGIYVLPDPSLAAPIQCAEETPKAITPSGSSFAQTFNFFWDIPGGSCSVSTVEVAGSDDAGDFASKITSYGYNQSDLNKGGCPNINSNRLIERLVVKRRAPGN